jgi:DNA-binding MarR family transcriptional regulator
LIPYPGGMETIALTLADDETDEYEVVAESPQPSCADLGWALNVIFRTFRHWANSTLADLPSGPRGYLVLSGISQDLARSQLALAQQLAVDKTAMTYLLDDLEGAGLVERRADPADRRQRQVLLTDRGRHALEEFGNRLGDTERRLLSALTTDEAIVLRQLLDRVAQSTRESEEPCTVADIAEDEEPCDS